MLLVLVVCASLPFSKAANSVSNCNAFQRYVLGTKGCGETEKNLSQPVVQTNCNYFQRYVLWRKDCSHNDISETSYSKCNDLERTLLGKEYCDYLPDEFLDVPQIIARHGFLSETHVVVTEDGYLLKVHRIPNPKGQGQPIFLQHGLLGSSADWVINGDNALAFLLADQGYDVWLGNARGNTYSRAHVSLPNTHAAFWNFSFHEMGTMDLPAVTSYIARTTNKPGEIIYVGHSMGTTMFYIFASENPKAAKNVKAMVGLASVAYMTHIKSPLKYFAPLSNDLEWFRNFLGFNQFLPNSRVVRAISYQCELFSVEKKICRNMLFAFCGYDKEEFNSKILPVILQKHPAGASTKTIIHYAQEIRNYGNFQKYDYGAKSNLIEYGSVTPPSYNIFAIETPVYLIYAMNDWLSNSVDVLRFASKLKTLEGVYKIKSDTFSHVDYIFGKHAETLVYRPLMRFIGNYTEH